MSEKVNLRPLRNGILGEAIYEDKYVGSLLIEQNARTNKLKVLRKGKECLEVEEGDIVMYNGRVIELEHDKKTYIHLTERECVYIIE